MDNETNSSTSRRRPSNGDYPLETLPSDFPVPDFSMPHYPVTPNLPVPPNEPVSPNLPGGGIGSVIIPIYPGSVNYTQVRFLNAAAGYPPLMISIGQRLISSKLAYENITPYSRINTGYRTVTISEAANPENILYRKSVSFIAGRQITLSIVNVANGLQLVEVSDFLCTNKSWNTGCIRVVNLSYGSGSFDISLDNGQTVFSDIEFTEVSPFKQASRGTYQMNVYEASPGIQPRSGYDPILTFPLTIVGNEMYTVYLVGSTFARPSLSSVIVTNT